MEQKSQEYPFSFYKTALNHPLSRCHCAVATTDEAPDFTSSFAPQPILLPGLGQICPESTQLQLAKVTSRCLTRRYMFLLSPLHCAESVFPAEPREQPRAPQVRVTTSFS